ncbi:MAG: hypothetical protein J0M08_12980 [Bacteroidetes bacterium]|nr:hypothetical protein [Bacteroidota bacterium]
MKNCTLLIILILWGNLLKGEILDKYCGTIETSILPFILQIVIFSCISFVLCKKNKGFIFTIPIILILFFWFYPIANNDLDGTGNLIEIYSEMSYNGNSNDECALYFNPTLFILGIATIIISGVIGRRSGQSPK